MTAAEILSMPIGIAKLDAIVAFNNRIALAGATCPNCAEERQVQLVDAFHVNGPKWRCRKCKHPFHTEQQ